MKIVDVNGNPESGMLALCGGPTGPGTGSDGFLKNAHVGDVGDVGPLRDAFQSLSDIAKELGEICKNLSVSGELGGLGRREEVATARTRADPVNDYLPYQRCAPGVSEVLPHLLLGGAAALRPGLLNALGVTCVVNCATELPSMPVPDRTAYLKIPLADHPSAPLHEHLDTVADAIEEVRLQGGRTLVHCVAGVSRSAALVLGYLVKHRGMPLAEAFHFLRGARPLVRPNSGFFRQLIDWEERHLGVCSVRMVVHPLLSATDPIPDVYEAEYRKTVEFHRKYSTSNHNRNFGRV